MASSISQKPGCDRDGTTDFDVTYATDGNLWIVDQPSRLRHGFIRIELPAE